MLNIGDELVVTKKVSSFLDVGDIIKITDVDDNGIISFAFGNGFMHMGLMNNAECESHFEKIANKIATTITQEDIDEIINNSAFNVETMFDKCTVVACKLPNGFVIVESSACVSPENYNAELGYEICIKKIKDKVWELEGYRLQSKLYEMNKSNCDGDSYCDCDCYDCDVYNECEDHCCDECDYYECPNNPNY